MRPLTRRELVVAGAGTIGVLALGGFGLSRVLDDSESATEIVLRPQPETIELGGRTASSWTYGAGIPGPELRVRQGERVRVRVENGLPEKTTVHWHGIRIANDMDGVPDMPLPPIEPGASFTYDFVPPDAARTGSTRMSECSSTAGCTVRSSSRRATRRSTTTATPC